MSVSTGRTPPHPRVICLLLAFLSVSFRSPDAAVGCDDYDRYMRRVGLLMVPGVTNDSRDAAFRDGYAFIADPRLGLIVHDVRDPSNPRYVTHLPLPDGAISIALAPSYAYLVDVRTQVRGSPGAGHHEHV